MGRHDYYPFGPEIPRSGQADEPTKKYTGHERDPNSRADYMLGWTYLCPFMRFATLDPARDWWSLYANGSRARHGEACHTLEFNSSHPRQAPGGGDRSAHIPFRTDKQGLMNQEKGWVEIKSEEELEALLDLTLGFHDSVPVDLRWQGAEFVNSQGNLGLDGYGDLAVTVQMQHLPLAKLELSFENVVSFSYRYDRDLEAQVTGLPEGLSVKFGNLEIEAFRLFYRKI